MCGRNDVMLGYIPDGSISKVCSIDESTRAQPINVVATIGGKTATYDSDLYTSTTVNGVSVVANSALRDSGYFAFVFYDGQSAYYLPNDNYTKDTTLDWNTLVRGWDTFTDSYSDAVTGARYSPSGDLCSMFKDENNQYCRSVRHTCSGLNSAGLLTADKLSTLPSGMTVGACGTSTCLLATSQTSDVSLTIKYSALFMRAPPQLQITGYSAKCNDNYMVIYYNNSGNVGAVKLKAVFTDGTTQTVNYDVDYGVNSMRVMYMNGLNQICFGDDCTIISCNNGTIEPLKKVDDSIWFNSNRKGLYAFEVVMTILVGIAFIVFSFYFLRWLWRKMPNLWCFRWGSKAANSYNKFGTGRGKNRIA